MDGKGELGVVEVDSWMDGKGELGVVEAERGLAGEERGGGWRGKSEGGGKAERGFGGVERGWAIRWRGVVLRDMDARVAKGREGGERPADLAEFDSS